jgi:hypothetical protein
MSPLAVRRPTVVTERDVALLRSLAQFRVLSVAQLERLHFPSRQTARRRLRLLAGEKLVRITRPAGLTERVVQLREAGARLLRGAAGSETGITAPDVVHPLFIQHALQVAEFCLRMTSACSEHTGVRCLGVLHDRVAGHGQAALARHLSGEMATAHGEVIRHCPDAAIALEHRGQAALFFLEIDRGTEVIGREERGVGKILRYYLHALMHNHHQRLRRDFGVTEEFRGFRVLFVTSSSRRLEHIRARGGAMPFEPALAKRFIWLATETVLKDERLLEHRWCSLDPADTVQYTLAPQP